MGGLELIDEVWSIVVQGRLGVRPAKKVVIEKGRQSLLPDEDALDLRQEISGGSAACKSLSDLHSRNSTC